MLTYADVYRNVSIPATGGGGHKFASLFADQLGVRLMPNDEMRSVISHGFRV